MSGKEIISKEVASGIDVQKPTENVLYDEIKFHSRITTIGYRYYWDIVVGLVFIFIWALIMYKEDLSFFNLNAIVFFLLGIVTTIATILWKLRYRKFRASKVSVAGGVPIYKDVSQSILFSWFICLGGLSIPFSPAGISIVTIGISAFVVLLSVMIFTAVLKARKRHYLQFDRKAITIGLNSSRAIIPWGCIARIEADEFASNPVLLLWLKRPDRVEIVPASSRREGFAGLRGGYWKSDVVLFPEAYKVDLPVLGAAIARFAADSKAREELVLRKING